MDKLLLLDGHSLLTRAFYGVPELTNQEGIHTNAVYGFLSMLFKYIEDEKPQYIACAFDLKREALLRTRIYPAYKGTRKPMPPELHEQVPLTEEILQAMGIPVMTLEGYEADDILGTVARRAAREGCEVTIVSGDRDLLQLAAESIKISIPKTFRGRTEVFNYYPEDVLKGYRVSPAEIIELKGLMGDSSDNIPGLPGVGPKTATQIIVDYKTIENAYAHLSGIKPPRAQKALAEHYDLALLSRKLATIDVDAPVEVDYTSGCTSRIYTHRALELMMRLGLRTLSARFARFVDENTDEIEKSVESEKAFDPDSLKLISDPYMADVIFHDMVDEDIVGFWIYGEPMGDVTGGGNLGQEALFRDMEGEDLSRQSAESIASLILSLALGTDRIYCIRSCADYPAEKIRQDFEAALKKRIAREKPLATIALKDELKILRIQRNSSIKDVSIACYLLDPTRASYEYDDIAEGILNIDLKGERELLGKRSLLQALRDGDENALKPAVLKAVIALKAYRELMRRLDRSGMQGLYDGIEMPLVYSLDHMEKAGIAVDRASLSSYAKLLKGQMDRVAGQIHELAGEDFNINSPQQLGVILFEKLGIKGAKKTKTGYSTAAGVLEKLVDTHPIIPRILRYRALSKLYSTYAYGLGEYIGPDGRIHSTFNQTITATGRISSTDPNLQNIPVRTGEGKEIRKVFVPARGFIFVDADYSQVELRILASLSGDEALIQAYKDAVDIHTLTASQVFHVPISEVTEKMRRDAKAVNFGIVYGISAFGLGEDLSISRQEASEYISQYFRSYPKVKEYLEKCVSKAKETGFVTTAFGRVRPIPELKSSNYALRSFGERIAMNSPIQGTAADIMKKAMNDVDIALCGMKSRIVLQVHDELLIETTPDEQIEVQEIVKEKMEQAADLSVPLIVDVRSGSSWYECH